MFPQPSPTTVELTQFEDDTVPMLIWSATESCVTVMCSTIPVLRPLYLRLRYGKDSQSGSSGNTSYKLPLYGSGRNYGRLTKSGNEISAIVTDISYQKSPMQHKKNNTSDETILRGAAGIERTDEVMVSWERPGKNG